MNYKITFGAMLLIAAGLIFFNKIKEGEMEDELSMLNLKLEEASAKLEELKGNKVIKGEFSHTVLIWLKNPDSEDDRKQIEGGLKQLIEDSEFIQSAHLGTPAGTDRAVVDNSYAYCLIVTFEDAAAQDQYQVELAHKKFIEDNKDLWSKVLIYDAINVLE